MRHGGIGVHQKEPGNAYKELGTVSNMRELPYARAPRSLVIVRSGSRYAHPARTPDKSHRSALVGGAIIWILDTP